MGRAARVNEGMGADEESPLVWVVTDQRGEILEASAEAAQLLSVTPAHLRQRSLLLFFLADRPEWIRVLQDAARGATIERAGWIRPRDRRPRPVRVELTRAADYQRSGAVVWRFESPAGAPPSTGA